MLRSHSERLVRSLALSQACDPTRRESKQKGIRPAGGDLRLACPANLQELNKKSLKEVWLASCYTCRLFGNTGLAGRVKTSDWYPTIAPLTEVRYGVAIDRVTNAVAQGPFQAETVTDGEFMGEISLRNFTLGQLGLVAATLLDLDDGLVALGYAKSRGLGRVKLTFGNLTFRFPRDPDGYLKGLGSLVDEDRREAYGLPPDDHQPLEVPANQVRWFHQVQLVGDAVQPLLEALSPRWVNEVGSGGA
jgi:CRISPR/Cas system CSM-associated protein Csm3 (group 7 of RAMP superfamily)